MTEKVANPMNWLKLIGSAAAKGARGAGQSIRSAAPGAAADASIGAGLTALDYGYIPYLKNPLLGWNQVETMQNAPWDEKALSWIVNSAAGAGMRRAPSGWRAVTIPAGLLTSPAINILRNSANLGVSSGEFAGNITKRMDDANTTALKWFGGTEVDPVTGKLVNPGKLNELSEYADNLIKGTKSSLSNAATLGGVVGGAGLGGLAANYFATEPVSSTTDPEEYSKKHLRNRLITGLGAALGAGLGGLAGSYVKAAGAQVNTQSRKEKSATAAVNWDNVKSHAVSSALRAALGAGIGAGVNQVHEAFVPTTNDRERRLKSRLALIGGAGAGLGGGISEALRDYMNTGFKTVQASETVPGAGYGGYQGLSLQSNMPISQRRQLTAAERKDVDAGQSKWFRGPFASEGDSISARMASPFKRSLLAALATTAAGAGLGAYASSNSGGNPFDGALAGGGLGALGGIPMGILAYMEQQKLNKTLEERMRRLPEGMTTIRDMMSDPVTGYGERMQSMQDQMNPSFSGNQLAQLATLAARMPRR